MEGERDGGREGGKGRECGREGGSVGGRRKRELTKCSQLFLNRSQLLFLILVRALSQTLPRWEVDFLETF